jgi:hypothetical protein
MLTCCKHDKTEKQSGELPQSSGACEKFILLGSHPVQIGTFERKQSGDFLSPRKEKKKTRRLPCAVRVLRVVYAYHFPSTSA